jgi:FixJ family two-component response regulator
MPYSSFLHKVAVVEDDLAVRESIVYILKSVGIHSFEFDSALALLAAPELINICDCIILDVRMPHMSGVDAHKKLINSGIHIPVVFITGHGNVRLAVEAMKLGAVEFLEKPFNDQMLIDAVHAAFNAPELRTKNLENNTISTINELTAREREIINHLIAGLRTKAIANILCLSPRTVEVYRARIYRKLNVSTLPQLMVIALKSLDVLRNEA